MTPGLPAVLAGDERLARLVGGGSERAFAILYERYHQRLYRYVRAMLRHDADAQDALQSALAKAFSALVEDRRDAPLRPWLYRIAHNEAVSIMRRRRPEVELSAVGEQTSRSAEEEAGERAALAQLVSDLGQLTDRQRGALVMRELSGLTHAEIDAALALDPGGAKQTIFEARRSLGEFAEGRAMSCDDVCRAISDGGGRSLRGRGIRAHLRDCGGCAAFAAAIPARSRDLRAIAPPLPAAAAAVLLTRALGAGSGSAGGASGVVAAVAGKAAGITLSSKVIAGLAVVAVAGAGAGTAGLVSQPPPATGHAQSAGAARAGAVGRKHRRSPLTATATLVAPTSAGSSSGRSGRQRVIAPAHAAPAAHGHGRSGRASGVHREAAHGRAVHGARGHGHTPHRQNAGGSAVHGQSTHSRVAVVRGPHASPAHGSARQAGTRGNVPGGRGITGVTGATHAPKPASAHPGAAVGHGTPAVIGNRSRSSRAPSASTGAVTSTSSPAGASRNKAK